MEGEPDTDNVVYLDEYPEARKRVWLRRLHAERHMGVIALPQIIPFPRDPEDDPDGAA